MQSQVSLLHNSLISQPVFDIPTQTPSFFHILWDLSLAKYLHNLLIQVTIPVESHCPARTGPTHTGFFSHRLQLPDLDNCNLIHYLLDIICSSKLAGFNLLVLCCWKIVHFSEQIMPASGQTSQHLRAKWRLLCLLSFKY